MRFKNVAEILSEKIILLGLSLAIAALPASSVADDRTTAPAVDERCELRANEPSNELEAGEVIGSIADLTEWLDFGSSNRPKVATIDCMHFLTEVRLSNYPSSWRSGGERHIFISDAGSNELIVSRKNDVTFFSKKSEESGRRRSETYGCGREMRPSSEPGTRNTDIVCQSYILYNMETSINEDNGKLVSLIRIFLGPQWIGGVVVGSNGAANELEYNINVLGTFVEMNRE